MKRKKEKSIYPCKKKGNIIKTFQTMLKGRSFSEHIKKKYGFAIKSAEFSELIFLRRFAPRAAHNFFYNINIINFTSNHSFKHINFFVLKLERLFYKYLRSEKDYSCLQGHWKSFQHNKNISGSSVFPQKFSSQFLNTYLLKSFISPGSMKAAAGKYLSGMPFGVTGYMQRDILYKDSIIKNHKNFFNPGALFYSLNPQELSKTNILSTFRDIYRHYTSAVQVLEKIGNNGRKYDHNITVDSSSFISNNIPLVTLKLISSARNIQNINTGKTSGFSSSSSITNNYLKSGDISHRMPVLNNSQIHSRPFPPSAKNEKMPTETGYTAKIFPVSLPSYANHFNLSFKNINTGKTSGFSSSSLIANNYLKSGDISHSMPILNNSHIHSRPFPPSAKNEKMSSKGGLAADIAMPLRRHQPKGYPEKTLSLKYSYMPGQIFQILFSKKKEAANKRAISRTGMKKSNLKMISPLTALTANNVTISGSNKKLDLFSNAINYDDKISVLLTPAGLKSSFNYTAYRINKQSYDNALVRSVHTHKNSLSKMDKVNIGTSSLNKKHFSNNYYSFNKTYPEANSVDDKNFNARDFAGGTYREYPVMTFQTIKHDEKNDVIEKAEDKYTENSKSFVKRSDTETINHIIKDHREVHVLADEVYKLFEKKLMIEKERKGF